MSQTPESNELLAEEVLQTTLRAYAKALGVADKDHFVSAASDAVHEVLDGFERLERQPTETQERAS